MHSSAGWEQCRLLQRHRVQRRRNLERWGARLMVRDLVWGSGRLFAGLLQQMRRHTRDQPSSNSMWTTLTIPFNVPFWCLWVMLKQRDAWYLTRTFPHIFKSINTIKNEHAVFIGSSVDQALLQLLQAHRGKGRQCRRGCCNYRSPCARLLGNSQYFSEPPASWFSELAGGGFIY